MVFLCVIQIAFKIRKHTKIRKFVVKGCCVKYNQVYKGNSAESSILIWIALYYHKPFSVNNLNTNSISKRRLFMGVKIKQKKFGKNKWSRKRDIFTLLIIKVLFVDSISYTHVDWRIYLVREHFEGVLTLYLTNSLKRDSFWGKQTVCWQ